jgi:hypothetical protein
LNAEIARVLVALTVELNGRRKYYRKDDAETVAWPRLIVTDNN